jgi:hypothetical protein
MSKEGPKKSKKVLESPTKANKTNQVFYKLPLQIPGGGYPDFVLPNLQKNLNMANKKAR